MPILGVRRSHAVLTLLALGAAAPMAGAQYQIEVSLDQTGSYSMHSVFAAGRGQLSQLEAVRYSVGASRLARIAPGTSLRLGLSLANRGFNERSVTHSPAGTQTRESHVDLLYLGAPLTLGFNLVDAGRGLRPFVEAGVVPELLVLEDESAFDFDLRKGGVSYLLNFGVKYNLEDGRALLLAPEARIAAREYSRDTPGGLEFRPVTIGIKLGIHF